MQNVTAMNEPRLNLPELTVSELSASLKRTVEDAYGYVRVRGEISGCKGPHSSGHAYFALKDESAKIDAVIWRGSFARMRIKPEDGPRSHRHRQAHDLSEPVELSDHRRHAGAVGPRRAHGASGRAQAAARCRRSVRRGTQEAAAVRCRRSSASSPRQPAP